MAGSWVLDLWYGLLLEHAELEVIPRKDFPEAEDAPAQDPEADPEA